MEGSLHSLHVAPPSTHGQKLTVVFFACNIIRGLHALLQLVSELNFSMLLMLS